MLKSAIAFLKRIRFITVCLILGGLVIYFLFKDLASKNHWFDLIVHIGDALIIVGSVGLIIELTEIRDFFERRLSDILSKDEFLDSLSPSKIKNLSYSLMEKLTKEKVNNVFYNSRGFFYTINEEVLPLMGKCYRSDYFETIDYSLMSPYYCNFVLLYPFDYDKFGFKIISYNRGDSHGYISMLLSQQRMRRLWKEGTR